MEQPIEIQLALSIKTAEEGVDYHVQSGAICPWCGKRLRVTHTLPWDGSLRLRYHKCINPKCPLSVMDKTVKSTQEI